MQKSSFSFYVTPEAREKSLTLGVPRDGDAGFDLPSLEDVTVEPRTRKLLKTGIHMAIPVGWVGLIRDRSSVAMKGGAVTAGVIDAGYRGEVRVLFHNLSDEPMKFAVGDRIAQCLIIPHLDGESVVEAENLENLGSTERGEGGFGSTGK